jgi:hypothetical protein
MAGQADFTDAEWAEVMASPMVAGMAITLADPSGLWGIVKESLASGRALVDARRDAGGSVLAKAVTDALETSEGRTAAKAQVKAAVTGTTPAEMKASALAALASVSRLLAAKDPAEAEAFRVFLNGVALRVAEASKEGGFLGFGGVAVSDAERATLDEVRAALG